MRTVRRTQRPVDNEYYVTNSTRTQQRVANSTVIQRSYYERNNDASGTTNATNIRMNEFDTNETTDPTTARHRTRRSILDDNDAPANELSDESSGATNAMTRRMNEVITERKTERRERQSDGATM